MSKETDDLASALKELRTLRILVGILLSCFLFVFYLLDQYAADIRVLETKVENLKNARGKIEMRLDNLGQEQKQQNREKSDERRLPR